MRVCRWFAMVAVLVLVAACGGGDESGAPDISDEELAEALIALNELPSGWSIDTEDEDDADASGTNFCDAEPLDEQFEEAAEADASFLRSETGPFLVHAIGALGEGDAEAAMETMREAFDCETWTDPDTDTEWTVAEMNFADVGGDEQFAIRANTTAGIFTAEAQIIGFRVDGYLSIVGHIAIGEADVEFTEEMAQLAADKLEELP